MASTTTCLGSVESIARVVTWLGGVIGASVVTVVAVVVLWRASRRADALFVAGAVVGITVLVAVLKAVYERARPDLGTVVALPHSYSFPSGHAATAVVLYGALAVLLAERASSRLRAVAWLAGAAVLALAIGTSRVAAQRPLRQRCRGRLRRRARVAVLLR